MGPRDGLRFTRMRFCRSAVVLFLAVSSSFPASAQTFYGSIRGRIVDADGVVAAAVVDLIDPHTGTRRSTTTNDGGEYLFASVAPGTYTLHAEKTGYRAAEVALVLGTNGAITRDLTLLPGAVEAVMVVAGDSNDIRHGVLGTTFTNADLVAQPTAGRNVFIMGALAPTVLPTGNAVFVRQQDQSNASLISMAGSARRANTYVIDGVPIVDIQNRATIIPGMESIDEMRVQLGPYDTEVGRTSGGVFNVTARSGTNLWSGSGVYQNRPDATHPFSTRRKGRSPNISR